MSNLGVNRARAARHIAALWLPLIIVAAGHCAIAGAATDPEDSLFPDLRGDYSGGVCTSGTLAQCEANPEYPHTKTISTEDFDTGAVSGPGFTGQIKGCTLTIHVTDGDYTSTEVEKISKDTQLLAGSFSDSSGQSGPDFDRRTSGEEATCPPSCPTGAADPGDGRPSDPARAKGCKVTLSGTVRYHKCASSEGQCFEIVRGAPERPVSVSGDGKTKETETGSDGRWSVKVRAGKRYEVRLPGGQGSSHPATRTVNAKRNVDGLDFTRCKVPDRFQPQNIGCDLVRVDGTIVDGAGAAYLTNGQDSLFVKGPGDQVQVGGGSPNGFSLYLPRGQQRITGYQQPFGGLAFGLFDFPLIKNVFDLRNDSNQVRLAAKPAFAATLGDSDKVVNVGLAGLPAGLEPTLDYALTGGQEASCQFNQSGTIPLQADGHIAYANISPVSFSTFCHIRFTLTVYSGDTQVAQTSFRIT